MATLEEVMDLAATVEGVAGEVGPDGTTTWSGTGGPFAALHPGGGGASFRLDRELAAAAVRTPDTNASERGPDWVDFVPREVDDHAIDRATAWFAAAARRSG
jgi:hypothetical protein